MGTGTQPFDIQNFFKSSGSSPSPPPAPPSAPGYNLPNHPYPGTPYPPQGFAPYSQSAPPYAQYMHYSQDHVRPPYQPAFSQSVVASLPQTSTPTSASSPPLDGTRLMALLTAQSTGDLRDSSTLLSSLELPPPAVTSPGVTNSMETSEAPPAISPAMPSAPPVSLAPPSTVKSSGKLAKGRYLNGERLVYDIDNRMRGEEQPQLEVSTITVYSSEPMYVVGRQIAVNKCYICYGLRAGTIRVLNINTASRNLFRGHTQRVVDMMFVSNDVHVLASTSTEGRVFVRKIVEGPGEDGQNHIADQILVGIQFSGEWDTAQPRVCWHTRQDILVVGIGKHVLTIDLKKFRSGGFSAEEPIKCSIKNPVDGVVVLGSHQDEVTALAACPGINRFASSSKDGTVRLWSDTELVILAPHSMLPVNALSFVCSPRHQDQLVLVTAGPLNRELKLWAPAGTDGLNWKCIQTLELRSSAEKKVEDAFFNQMMVVSQGSLILLANAKKSAIYAVHLEFGQTASATRMDYLSEFSLKMPILSFMATSDNVVDGEGTIQVYCVQTQAIQQYALDLAMCLPPVQDSSSLMSEAFTPGLTTSSTRPSLEKTTPSTASDSVAVTTDKQKSYGDSSLYETKEEKEKLSPDSDQIDKTILPDAVLADAEPTKVADSKSEVNDSKEEKDGTPKSSKPHLVTPFELMSMATRGKTEAPMKSGDLDDEPKDADVGESGMTDTKIISDSFEDRGRSFVEGGDSILDSLDNGDSDVQVEADVLIQTFTPPIQLDEAELPDERTAGMTLDDIAMAELKEVSSKTSEYSAASVSQSPAVSKGRKNKNKASAGAAVQTAVSPPEAEATVSSGSPTSDSLAACLQTMQESLNQLVVYHKDIQKQFSPMVTAAMAKEGKRMEASLGQRLEKTVKANVDSLLAKVQEENAKREKAERERYQQLMSLMGSTKDLPASLERIVKKELAAMGSAVAKILSPSIEKAVTSGIADSSQSFNEKTLLHLDKSIATKLESSVARQLQSQFQSTGRQALQEAMRTCFEGSVVPSFERSCKTMFEQVDTAFQKGMSEHISHAQQQASASQESMNNFVQALKSELADNQRKLAAFADNRYTFPMKPTSGALPDSAFSLQHVEEALDPTIEISRLVSQGKLEDAFNRALSRSDVTIVSWLCNQVDPNNVFSATPIPLSQGVLLSLVQQLGCDLGKDTARKLNWIQGACLALNPSDPVLAPHMRPFLDQLYQNLHRQAMIPATPELASSLRLVIHVVNSLLTSCK